MEHCEYCGKECKDKKHVEIENVLAQDGTVADTFEL